MNLRAFFYSGTAVLLLFVCSSFSETHDAKVTVKISNFANSNGYVEVAIYNNSSKFPKVGQHHKMKRIKLEKRYVEYTFTGLKPGKYAICAYHDDNSDKKINKNWLGIPTEGYAFSNNYVPKFSAPNFSDCSFSLERHRAISIKMIN